MNRWDHGRVHLEVIVVLREMNNGPAYVIKNHLDGVFMLGGITMKNKTALCAITAVLLGGVGLVGIEGKGMAESATQTYYVAPWGSC